MGHNSVKFGLFVEKSSIYGSSFMVRFQLKRLLPSHQFVNADRVAAWISPNGSLESVDRYTTCLVT